MIADIYTNHIFLHPSTFVSGQKVFHYASFEQFSTLKICLYLCCVSRFGTYVPCNSAAIRCFKFIIKSNKDYLTFHVLCFFCCWVKVFSVFHSSFTQFFCDININNSAVVSKCEFNDFKLCMVTNEGVLHSVIITDVICKNVFSYKCSPTEDI